MVIMCSEAEISKKVTVANLDLYFCTGVFDVSNLHHVLSYFLDNIKRSFYETVRIDA